MSDNPYATWVPQVGEIVRDCRFKTLRFVVLKVGGLFHRGEVLIDMVDGANASSWQPIAVLRPVDEAERWA